MTSIEAALRDFKAGKMVIVTDDEGRENEGDLVLAAGAVTPEKIAFMVRHTSGIICIPMTGERLDKLQLPPMVSQNTELHRTAFTVSVDFKKGTTTGISAADRAATIQALIDPRTKPADFSRPGHIFPLRYTEGGVLKRAGHTEASIDLARMAGIYPAAVICELVKEDGSMARMPDLKDFAKTHGLPMITIGQLIAYRKQHERLVEKVAEAKLPTRYGTFDMKVYHSKVDDKEHVALMKGTPKNRTTLVRVHSECLTGDVFHSGRCDCGDQLEKALERIGRAPTGVFLYIRQEGRGIGLVNKIKAYGLQDKGYDTVTANQKLGLPADLRDYGIGAQILADLGVKKMNLLTNNPCKIVGLEGHGLQLVKRVSLEVEPGKNNRRYLKTKKKKMGHLLRNV